MMGENRTEYDCINTIKNECDTPKERKNKKNCSQCFISTEESIHSRRCFMTGEYCSKQTSIQRERTKLYNKKQISAFVIMNFSDMSDVVYKWRLHDFIESLSKYLYFDNNKKRLYCCTSERKEKRDDDVEKIQVVRSDSDPASNYVICSRICQQMQIADLVIVDVSNQNPNVFYELGMAVALGKLILPICYSESYYKMLIPKKIKKNPELYSEVEHHIGCSPWRKSLFEYYGIRYKNWTDEEIQRDKEKPDNDKSNTKTRYLNFKTATDSKYGFSDIQYNRFPYHEKIDGNQIGITIYNNLSEKYNCSSSKDNTLVVYTMENFLNREQAGRCIVNFYHDITARMRQEQCFCGERVGVLVQANFIPENDKDTAEQLNLNYKVGEIIHIGVNQATYCAAEGKIKTADFMPPPPQFETNGFTEKEKEELKYNEMRSEQCERISQYIKRYIRNRGILVYPDNPIYVNRVKNHIDELLPNNCHPDSTVVCNCANEDAFCLYHVMLKTLRNTNEIVVDLSNNCLQALFWLGAAHGSDIYAITVLHEETDKERKLITGSTEKKTRNIFDVAGLWTAIFRSNDTDGFYHQLAQVQKGIELHSNLMVLNEKISQINMWDYLTDSSFDFLQTLTQVKKTEEEHMLESYYLNRFWNPMLRYNRLRIYLPQTHEIGNTGNPSEGYTAKCDFQIASALSYYLSETTLIGEYRMISQSKNDSDPDAENVNFICVGETGIENIILQSLSSQISAFPSKSEALTTSTEIGRLILLRENPKTLHDRSFFRVALSGTSGTATLGLVSLFVDDEQKLHLFSKKKCNSENSDDNSNNEFKNKHLLCELQAEVRRQFMERFREKLKEKLEIILQEEIGQNLNNESRLDAKKNRYIKLVIYAVTSYLSTVLYRYFLPFLSEKDINRIYNGMNTFINSMKADNESPFALDYPPDGDPDYDSNIPYKCVSKITQEIPTLLKSTLQSFIGLEAFYKITTSHSSKGDSAMGQGTTGIVNIEMFDKQSVTCFF